MRQLKTKFNFRAKVWRHLGHVGWHLVTLPKKLSAEIKKVFSDLHGGWSSLRVMVKIGETEWKTSIFYDTKASAYVMGIKEEVRKKENISLDDIVNFSIEIIV